LRIKEQEPRLTLQEHDDDDDDDDDDDVINITINRDRKIVDSYFFVTIKPTRKSFF